MRNKSFKVFFSLVFLSAILLTGCGSEDLDVTEESNIQEEGQFSGSVTQEEMQISDISANDPTSGKFSILGYSIQLPCEMSHVRGSVFSDMGDKENEVLGPGETADVKIKSIDSFHDIVCGIYNPTNKKIKYSEAMVYSVSVNEDSARFWEVIFPCNITFDNDLDEMIEIIGSEPVKNRTEGTEGWESEHGAFSLSFHSVDIIRIKISVNIPE